MIMKKTVLLIDDDEFIITIGEAMLEKLGYTALLAESGEKALQLIEKQGEAIHLVIMDMIMPGMDGEELFDRLRALCPNLPVILSSGYSQSDRITGLLDRGCQCFIKKPYSLTDLSNKIQDTLSQA
jgi:CheY-like chemotaxis protein